ncbi:MAG: membrane protein insertion efficiency factor YidD [Candidatus Sungbacteria bacterium]|uniref:Membrane protein insertion efficiency factor YidD n=1 Tax=Candidatus Sungiibacteriota bacterium TaxID=2750080 RepID=A0A9D6DR20_9BACT|nr:membrane protein insertion efficiency factor YidD [Candidatus Sungbacteria bacterium]
MNWLVIFLVKCYQKLLSPRTGVFRFVYFWPILSLNPSLWAGCRQQPSCSQYCLQAVSRYGAIKGLVLSIKRIIACR